MTIIKQRGVTSQKHQRNLRDYINNDKKVLLRDSLNMSDCLNLKRWAFYMSKTRDRFGHNQPARKGRNGKPAKNTILYHQILAFNPDECDINSGKLSPEDCMTYAKEYVKKYYPNQQVVFALHNEYCKEDKTHRYAVHMVINRSNLETGNRLNEGRGQKAKVERANRIRDMDDKWQLKQVERDKINSKVHHKQLSQLEQAYVARGEVPYKTNLRELCKLAATKAETIYQYRTLLESWGVHTEFRHGKMYATDVDNSKYSFSIQRLDAELSPHGLKQSFQKNVSASIRQKGTEVQRKTQTFTREQTKLIRLKANYLKQIQQEYIDYRQEILAMQGRALADIPQLKLTQPPKEIETDAEVKRLILACWRGGDELRAKLASNTPHKKQSKPSGGNTKQQTNTREVAQTKTYNKEQQR